MGVRQLRDPVQGLRLRRCPAHPFEKIADAAQVHRFTGRDAAVALHIPWDQVDDYAVLASHAADHGIELGTINSNLFQDDDYKLGILDAPRSAACGRKADRPSPGVHRRSCERPGPRT